MIQTIIATIVTALLVGAPIGDAGIDDEPETKNYIGLASGDLATTCETEDLTQACLGGAIFTDVPAGDIKVTVSDDATPEVTAAYFTPDGGLEFFCSNDEFTIDDFAGGEIAIGIAGPVIATLEIAIGGGCGNPAAIGTTGSIKLES